MHDGYTFRAIIVWYGQYKTLVCLSRNGERERSLVSKVIERVEARYDIEEVQVGKVYKWRPESVLIECECGERTILTVSDTTCEKCGEEHMDLLRKVRTEQCRGQLGKEDLHPWRNSEDIEDDDPVTWL